MDKKTAGGGSLARVDHTKMIKKKGFGNFGKMGKEPWQEHIKMEKKLENGVVGIGMMK